MLIIFNIIKIGTNRTVAEDWGKHRKIPVRSGDLIIISNGCWKLRIELASMHIDEENYLENCLICREVAHLNFYI